MPDHVVDWHTIGLTPIMDYINKIAICLYLVNSSDYQKYCHLLQSIVSSN